MMLGMSPRRAVRPARRRAARASTDAVQRRTQRELVADAAHEGLSVTSWFDSGPSGEPHPVTVTFRGRRDDIQGKERSGDTFTRVERIDRVVPGSGPVSITTWAYGLNPGAWTVTAELVRAATPALRGAPAPRRGGQTLPRARWSWLRWRLQEAPFGAVRTRWSPLVRFTGTPAVVPGSWAALVGLGIVAGIAALIWLLSFDGIPAGPALVVAVIGTLGGVVGAKVWYVVLRPRQWRTSLAEGWSIDGSIVAAPIATIAALLVLDLPVLAFLDAGAPAFFVGVGIGRMGCFLTGCCAGRCTASRWGVWSSDRRVGARRIPTQLMESALGLGLAVLFGSLVIADIPPIDGVVFVVGIGSYLGGRQLLLRMRADARSSSLGMEGRRPATAA